MSDVEKDGRDKNPEAHDEGANSDPESGDLHDDVTMPPEVARTSVDSPGVHDDATLPPKSGSGPFENTVDMPASGDGLTEASTSAGTRVQYFGDYELLEEIARGGMGVVYKARQVNLNRVVALKMILTGQLASEEDVQRFYTEAEAAAKLEHPGIVPIFEIGEHAGQHFFSMGFIDGESLADQVKEGPLPPREAASLTRQVAEAIAFAHENNVIHRDLKPANVLIDRNGQAKVTDFGLAKQTDAGAELTGTGQILGTPGYMPPEQAAGDTDRIGPAADIYSLGAVLYALLTGRAPFQSASVMDTLIQVLEKEPVAPRELNIAVDQDLETICLKCLQKEPGQRYQTASEFSDDLQRYLNGEAVLARPISQTARLWRWCKRNRTIATLAATVAVTLVVGIALSSYFAVEANNERNNAVILAAEKDKLAQEKIKLAADESDARRLAEEAETKERAARGVAQQQRGLAEQRLTRADWLLYVSHIGRAQSEWESGNVAAAWESLNAGRWDFRDWEHDYLFTLFNRNQRTLRGHRSGVTSVAFSLDGRRIVSGSSDKTLKVWDAASDQETLTLTGHTSIVSSVAFSPDGRRIASGSWDKTLKVWDVESGQATLTLTGHTSIVSSVAFSPDGRRIVSGSWDGTLKVWDVESGEETLTLKGHSLSVHSVAFSPDGRRIVSGSEFQGLKVWDAETGERTLTLKGHSGSVISVAFSPDGRRIVSGGGAPFKPGEMKVWDTESGQETLTLKGHASQVTSVAFSPDGRRIVSGSDDMTLKVWDAESGQETLTLKGHTQDVTSVAFSPDGRRIVSGSRGSTLKVWDAQSGQETLTLKGHTGFVISVAFSPDGRRIVSGGWDTTLKVWDAASGKETLALKGHTQYVTSVAFSPDGRQIVSGSRDSTPKVWDAETGEEMLTLKGHSGSVTSVAFSLDGRRIVSGSSDKTLKVWDAASGKETLALKGHTQYVTSVAFSPDGRQIVSGSRGSTLKVWDAETGEEMLTLKGHSGSVTSVAFSPDGRRIVSGSSDGTLKVWDVESGEETLTLKGHSLSVHSVAFSPDGRRIVSGSDDKTLKVWDAASGQEALTLKGHTERVTSIAFSRDGRRIVSGSFDKTLKVWNASQSELAMRGEAGIAKRNLYLIGLAFHNFHDTYGHLPPAVIYGPDGKPWHSWRVLLLPFLDAKDLYARYRFDEPWNGPNNRYLLKKIPYVYHDPKNKTHFTHYVVVTGERTARSATAFPISGVKFDGKGDVFKAMSGQKAGVTKFAHVIDGLSNVILAGTVTAETEIPWMKPEDLEFAKAIRPLGTRGSFGTPYKTGQKELGVFLFGDGRVRTLPKTHSVEILRRMILINDQKPVVFEDAP